MTDEPMIYTSKGNLPIASLRPAVQWTVNENEIILASELWQGEECVRREVHVKKLKGESALGAVGVWHGQ